MYMRRKFVCYVRVSAYGRARVCIRARQKSDSSELPKNYYDSLIVRMILSRMGGCVCVCVYVCVCVCMCVCMYVCVYIYNIIYHIRIHVYPIILRV